MTNKLVILSIDDWAALYVNGKRKYEGHDVRIEHVSAHCPIGSIECRYVDGTALDVFVSEKLYFPISISECEEILGSKI